MQKSFQCESCDADFKVKYNLDESYYEVMFCPFCGFEISEEEDDSEDYE